MEINDPQLNVNGLLTIDPVSFADRGEYQCEASNSLGRISSSFTLILSGKVPKHQSANVLLQTNLFDMKTIF